MAYPSTFLDIQTAVLQKARLDPALTEREAAMNAASPD